MLSRPNMTRLGATWLVLLAVGYVAGRLITDAHLGWDASLVESVRGSQHTALTEVMRFVTALGSAVVLDTVFVVALIALLLRHRCRDVLLLLFASLGTTALVQLLKLGVGRARPGGLHLTAAHGASWPSGHASNSMALYGALLLLSVSRWAPEGKRVSGGLRLGRRVAIGVTLLLIALIGVSRVYLGVHFPSDVLASWLLVGFWLTALHSTIALSSS